MRTSNAAGPGNRGPGGAPIQSEQAGEPVEPVGGVEVGADAFLASPAERAPTLEEVDQIRRILEEQKFNERVEQWLDGLKQRARIRRYVW